MRNGRWATGLALLLLLLGGVPARAQGVRLGLHANLGSGLSNTYGTNGTGAGLGLGVRAVWELGMEHEGLGFMGQVDVFEKHPRLTLPDPLTLQDFHIGGRYWEFNLHAIYARGSKTFKMYLGLGFNLANDTVDRDYLVDFTDNDALDIGGNVLLGAKLYEHVYVESRAEVRGGGQVVLTLGLLL